MGQSKDTASKMGPEEVPVALDLVKSDALEMLTNAEKNEDKKLPKKIQTFPKTIHHEPSNSLTFHTPV